MPEKEKRSAISALALLVVSLLLLSALSNILAGYPATPYEEKRPPEGDGGDPPSILVFEVSPAVPALFWSTSTADYYNGFTWLKTTEDEVLDELPGFQETNVTQLFTVAINTSLQEVYLPLPSSASSPTNMSVQPSESLRFAVDTAGDMVKVARIGEAERARLVYQAPWRESEIDDKQISIGNITEEIKAKYLQLPDIPPEVRILADSLKDSSYSILDQVLADVQSLKTNFVYDVERARAIYKGIPQESSLSTYLARRKGICTDAATLLAVILRIQEIPARISFGYKPGIVRGDKLQYFTTGGHSLTEVYLPPYGWVRFDATPTLQENPLVTALPFKRQAPPGSRLLHQLTVTNRRGFMDSFRLFVQSKLQWNISVVPSRLRVDAFQTVAALLNLSIPNYTPLGTKDTLTVTAVSMSQPEYAFSTSIIVQAENITQIPTVTRHENFDSNLVRGRAFKVHGTVATDNDEPISNMTILVLMMRSRGSESNVVGRGYSENGNFLIEYLLPSYMEVGDYRLVTVTLGTTLYATSSAESDMRLRAATAMEFGPEEDFSLGYGVIHGHLSMDNGTFLVGAPVLIEVASLADASKTWRFTNLTLRDGSFRIKTMFDDPGLYRINATFSGDDYRLRSNASLDARLRLESPTIQISSENLAIRGDSFTVSGAIQFRNVGIWGESVNIEFDNHLMAVVETKDNGSFTWSLPVGNDTELGSHSLIFAIRRSNVTAAHEVVVKSKTRLNMDASSVGGGMFLLLSASLQDDHGIPIKGAEITIENSGLSRKTDENGQLVLFLSNLKVRPGSSKLIATFQGSDLYLSATAGKETASELLSSVVFLAPLICPILIAVFLASSRRLLEARQNAIQTTATQVLTDAATSEEQYVDGMQPLSIVLPDVDARFPNVWGINDNLRIEIASHIEFLEKNEKLSLEVIIDDEPNASIDFVSKKSVEFSCSFTKKGEHVIRAILRRNPHQSWSAEVRILAVDYREEVIRLYNGFLEKLKDRGIELRKQMTGREIERVVSSRFNFRLEVLSRITMCFEKAEYSRHPIARRDYEAMYLSLKEVNIDVK